MMMRHNRISGNIFAERDRVAGRRLCVFSTEKEKEDKAVNPS